MSLKLRNKKIHLCISACADTNPFQSQNSEKINRAGGEKGHKSPQVQAFWQKKCLQHSLECRQWMNSAASTPRAALWVLCRAIKWEQNICQRLHWCAALETKSSSLVHQRGQDGSLASREKFFYQAALYRLQALILSLLQITGKKKIFFFSFEIDVNPSYWNIIANKQHSNTK